MRCRSSCGAGPAFELLEGMTIGCKLNEDFAEDACYSGLAGDRSCCPGRCSRRRRAAADCDLRSRHHAAAWLAAVRWAGAAGSRDRRSAAARGVVLLTEREPIVLCAVDWVGIGNRGYDAFRESLAKAAQTRPERVAVHCLHQHDAPGCDFAADELLRAQGLEDTEFNAAFAREAQQRIAAAIAKALEQPRTVTHVGVRQRQGGAGRLDPPHDRRRTARSSTSAGRRPRTRPSAPSPKARSTPSCISSASGTATSRWLRSPTTRRIRRATTARAA